MCLAKSSVRRVIWSIFHFFLYGLHFFQHPVKLDYECLIEFLNWRIQCKDVEQRQWQFYHHSTKLVKGTTAVSHLRSTIILRNDYHNAINVQYSSWSVPQLSRCQRSRRYVITLHKDNHDYRKRQHDLPRVPQFSYGRWKPVKNLTCTL